VKRPRTRSQRDPPTALIAGGNQILVGVLRAIRRRRLRVPQDLSVVTCDRTPLAEFLEPVLATIERDPRGLGHSAAQLLLEVLGGSAPRRVLLPVSFVPGQSCGPPP
jgi:LacI family transcriptional regulator